MSKFFTKKIDCFIPGARQHNAAYTAGDLLFDWVEFEIPRGAAKVVGVTALVRPKGDADPTPNNFPMSLMFGRAPAGGLTTSLGASNIVAFPEGYIIKHVVGSLEIGTADYMGPDTAVATSCLSVATSGTHHQGSIVLDPDLNTLYTGTNVGYDRWTVAGIANGAFDFITIQRINDGDIDTSSPGTTLVVDGTNMKPDEHFMVGDELITHGGAVIGTIASITNDTTIVLESAIETGVLADDDFVYAKHPITLYVHFEK